MAKITALPVEVWLEIIEKLDFLSDLHALAATSHHFHKICNNELYERTRIVTIRSGDQVDGNSAHASSQLRMSQEFTTDIINWCARYGKTSCIRRFLEKGLIPEPYPRWPDPLTIAFQFGHVGVATLLFRYRKQSIMHGLHSPRALHQHIFQSDSRTVPLQGGQHRSQEFAIEKGQKLVVKLLLQRRNAPNPEMYHRGCIIQFLRCAILRGYMSSPMKEFLIGFQRDSPGPDDDSHRFEYEEAFILAAALDSEAFRLLFESHVRCLQRLPKVIFTRAMDAALRNWNTQSVEIMLRYGYMLSYSADLEWRPPWDIALWSTTNIFFHISRSAGKQPDLCNLLLQYIDTRIVIRNESLWPIIHLLAMAAAENLTGLLMEIINIDWSTKSPWLKDWQFEDILSEILHFAVQYANVSTVRILVQAGADIEWLPNGHHARTIQVAAARGSFEVFEYLLDHMPRMNDVAAETLLESAVFPRRSMLLMRENLGPVEVKHQQDRQRMIKLLLEKYAFGHTPYYQVNNKFILAVACAGSKIFSMAERLADFKLNARSPTHLEIFQLAIRKASLYVVKRFLEEEFDATEALLFFFSTKNRNSRAFGHAHEAMLDMFLRNGAAINAYDPETRKTPLYCAIETMHLSVGYGTKYSTRPVEFLLRKGADPFLFNTSQCALTAAAQVGHIRTLKVLLNFFDEKQIPLQKIKRVIDECVGGSSRVLPVLDQWYRKRCP